MHILFCHERFVFRFGVDRVLLILAQGLKERGHKISFIANHFDRKILNKLSSSIIEIPDVNEYLNSNESTTEWLKNNWGEIFSKDEKPDIAFIGGWPFISAIEFFRKKNIEVVYSDHGVVPLEDYSGSHKEVLLKLKKLRKKYLKQSSVIIGVSKFITESQSRPDTKGQVPLYSILNGTDHLEMSIWKADQLQQLNKGTSLSQVTKIKSKGKKLILNLGRWEPNCYKNSDAAYSLLDILIKEQKNISLIVLADTNNFDIPKQYSQYIIPIGFPDDDELLQIMQAADLGVCFSLWEGFNLFLAEMQWFSKPALVFNIGAHPEVVVHPWFLCKDTEEMALKCIQVLNNKTSKYNISNKNYEHFKKTFAWENVVKRYDEVFNDVLNDRKSARSVNLQLFIDVTNASRDPANSGVIRVTRRLCRELQAYLDPIFVAWDNDLNTYVLLNENEHKVLASFNGPVPSHESPVSKHGNRLLLIDLLQKLNSPQAWLLFTETIQETVACKARNLAKQHGLLLGAIFYDAIPVLHPEFVLDEKIRNNHASYMKGLSACDVIIPISNFSGQCLKDFWLDEKITGCTITPDLLPGEFGGVERVKSSLPQNNKEIRILCVSTLEPRKNHRRLIEACLLIKKEHPDLMWKITFIGNRYAGAFELADYVASVAKEHKEIEWLGIVDDETLHNTYLSSDFTIYASVIEGFGLPVLESIWHGKPCLCHVKGVMSELARHGGCYTTDVTDPLAISDAIYRLATDTKLRLKLTQEAVSRPIKTWPEYTEYFLQILQIHTSSKKQHSNPTKNSSPQSWEDILYPECLLENWQMNHSERLALTALLARHKPKCSIEIGTFKGGSLSLISQYSDFVFSIDINSDIEDKFGYLNNVSFLTGHSKTVLPLLLSELDKQQISVDFILVDGDHSTEGIKNDINIILDYKPKKPLLVMVHDGFNPECRQGMIEADWEKSSYLNFADLDFIPGRLIEHGGGGHNELWGGLALFYMTPEKNMDDLTIQTSAEMMRNRVKNI